MNALSYKQKTWLLYVLLVLLAWLLYKKMFSSTILLVQNTAQLEEKLINAETNGSQMAELQREMAHYSKIALHTDSMPDPANEVLNFVSTASSAAHVQVESFDPPVSYTIQSYVINTFTIRLTGDYASLLKVIDMLERRVNSAKLASVRYYTHQKNSNSELKLYAELSLQYISRN